MELMAQQASSGGDPFLLEDDAKQQKTQMSWGIRIHYLPNFQEVLEQHPKTSRSNHRCKTPYIAEAYLSRAP